MGAGPQLLDAVVAPQIEGALPGSMAVEAYHDEPPICSPTSVTAILESCSCPRTSSSCVPRRVAWSTATCGRARSRSSANGGSPTSSSRKLRELGYFGLTIPERYGGLGLTTLAHLVVQEELGRAHAAFNMLISGNNGIGVMALVLSGTEAQKQRWLPRLASGEWIAAFALTEPNAGSDAQAIETRAVRDGDRYMLNGTKHYISRGDIADLVTVFAVTDPAVEVARARRHHRVRRRERHARLSRRAHPGLDGIRRRQAGGARLRGLRVSADSVVGEVGQGFATAMRTLDLGRLSLAARCLGTMEELLAVSVDAREEPRPVRQADRRAAGDPAHVGGHRDRHRDAAARHCTRRQVAATPARRVTHDAAMLKLYASEALGRAADRAVQIHGGMGFMRDCVVEGIYREARMMRIVGGHQRDPAAC